MADNYRVNVYDEDNDVIARVKYNADLDYWDGRNWTCGSTGRHLGITKLKTGDYVLIHGTDWQGEKDSAEIVTKSEALQKILKTGHADMLELKKFKDLKEMQKKMDEKYVEVEVEDEEEE